MKKTAQIFGIVLSLFIVLIIGLFIYPFYNPDEKTGNGKIDIVATFYPTYDISKNIVGDLANVEQVIPFGVEPHSFEPTPQNMLKIINSELFIYTGEHLDEWANEVANSTIYKENFLKLAPFVEIVNDDPHFWLSFSNFKKIIVAIEERISKIDPENSAIYKENRDGYLAQVENLENRFKTELGNCKLQKVIVNHNAFQYLSREFNFQTIPVMGLSPDEQPSAKRVGEIIELSKDGEISTIFFEELASDKVAQSISKESGLKVSSLSPVGNVPANKSNDGFLKIMSQNLENLKEALDCQ
jgi:zinc transport system substrate-binding protein